MSSLLAASKALTPIATTNWEDGDKASKSTKVKASPFSNVGFLGVVYKTLGNLQNQEITHLPPDLRLIICSYGAYSGNIWNTEGALDRPFHNCRTISLLAEDSIRQQPLYALAESNFTQGFSYFVAVAGIGTSQTVRDAFSYVRSTFSSDVPRTEVDDKLDDAHIYQIDADSLYPSLRMQFVCSANDLRDEWIGKETDYNMHLISANDP